MKYAVELYFDVESNRKIEVIRKSFSENKISF